MFSSLYEESCFVINYDFNNRIRIKTDFVAIDPYEHSGNIILLSLVDAPAKLDKIRADYKKNMLRSIDLENQNGHNVFREIDFKGDSPYIYELDFSGINFTISKKKCGNLSHMIFSQKNNSPYIFRFNKNESLVKLVMNKLINIFFIPCKEELVQEVLLSKKELLEEMIIITDNDELKDIEIYKFDKDEFVKTLNLIATARGETPDPIFTRFVGDFTGYINYFKPDILENLQSKIEEFYNPDNVPDYVTQFPYPLPNKNMRQLLNTISDRFYKVDLSKLKYDELINVYETYKKMDKEGKIQRTETFCPDWSRQYVAWAAGMEILKTERFLYASLVMGAGKTLMSLKVNKYTCEETLKRKNHLTFILCPQSTITQWLGEIELIEKGKGNTKDDYDTIIIDKTTTLMHFYNNHCRMKKGVMKFDKKTIEKPTYILCGKEAFKLSQVRRPAFNISFDNKFSPILICPNCGKPLVNYKKNKYDERVELSLKLDDFFNEKGKKILNSTNVFCQRCAKEMEEYEEFVEEKNQMKSRGQNTDDFFYANKFIPKDKNLWTLDFNSNNQIRNKLFERIEPIKKCEDKYTTFNHKDMLDKLAQRKELRRILRSNYSLRRMDCEKTDSKKISVIEFIKKRRFKFDSVIIDEAHEGNNAKSLIGTAQRLLFKFSEKVILLSGTANNGYASSLHNLLMAAMPRKLKEDGTFDKADFVRKYGILQGVIKVDEHGKVSGKADLPNSAFKEVEGINPVVFAKFLARNFIMVNTLQELDLPMPKLVERYIPIEVDEDIKNCYEKLTENVREVNPYMYSILKASVFKNYINNPYSWNEIEIRRSMSDEVIPIQPERVDRNIYPYLSKDYELIEIIKQEKFEGRKCFVFTDFVEGGKYIMEEEVEGRTKPVKVTINDRLCRLLEENGIKYMTIESTTTSVANRKNYIEDRKDDYDVFICQPQLVNVGLNLVFCPTYIVYTPFYKYDIISQATRRGYRANSTVENRIYHLYYSQTCEEDIINRYQRKLAEAKAIEGDFFVNIEQDKDLRTLSKLSNDIVKN